MLLRWGKAWLFLCVACGSDPATGGTATDTDTTGPEESSSSTGPIPPCGNAMELKQPGPMNLASGLFQCENGFRHRVQSVDCDPQGWTAGDCMGGNPESTCSQDSDCTDMGALEGRCIDTHNPAIGCVCNYGCRNDADCPSDQACYCDGVHTMCIPASCRTDSDCPTDQPCGLNELIVSQCEGNIEHTLSCATIEDECRIDTQCLDCQQCLRWIDQERWFCTENTGRCVACM